MAANEGTKYTNWSNIEVGTANGGGLVKIKGVNYNPTTYTELSAAHVCTAAESGTTFVLTGIVGYALTLPAPSAGLKYKFIVQDLFATTDWVITATAAIMYGSVMEASTVQAITAATTLNLELAADAIGDWVQVESDGTNWYVNGASAGALVTPA